MKLPGKSARIWKLLSLSWRVAIDTMTRSRTSYEQETLHDHAPGQHIRIMQTNELNVNRDTMQHLSDNKRRAANMHAARHVLSTCWMLYLHFIVLTPPECPTIAGSQGDALVFQVVTWPDYPGNWANMTNC